MADCRHNECLVCSEAPDLPERGRECLHRLFGALLPESLGGWAPFIVRNAAAAWRDGHIVGAHEKGDGG